MSSGPFNRVFLAAAILMLAAPTIAQGQLPRDPGHRNPGGAQVQPPQLLDMPAGQPVPVVPDTVQIGFAVPDTLPQPLNMHVVQDSLEFGGLLHLVWDYSPGQIDSPELFPASDGQWLAPYVAPDVGLVQRTLRPRREAEVDLSSLPATDNLRVVRSYRVYRRDPLQVQWQDQMSPVLTVVGQTAGAENTATIRAPRALTWTPWRLMALSALLLLAALAVYVLWRRRNQPAPLEHWPVPPSAWITTATSLQALLNENILARGDTRLFLDRLAFLARDYVAGRYRVAAREMTGPEIVAACKGLGHDPAHPAGFARLIDLADRERYNPTAPDAAFCREQAVQFMGRISRVRLEQQYIRVQPEKLLAAQKAWSALTADLGLGAGRAVVPQNAGEVG